MAWNRSSTNQQKETALRRGGKPRSTMRGIIAGGIVVLSAALAAWLFWPSANSDYQSENDNRKSLIKVVKPLQASTNRIADVESPGLHLELVDEHRVRHLAPTTTNKYPRRVIQRRATPPRRFEHKTDEFIAHFLETKPGAMMFGKIPFERYENEFRQSIADPIRIKDDDSDYDKQLKQAVIDTRKEIARQIGEGRSFAEVMQETRQDLMRLGQFKQSLEKELRAIRKNGEVSDEDYKTFVEAANKMLEEKGAAPIRTPYLIYRNLDLMEHKEGQVKE